MSESIDQALDRVEAAYEELPVLQGAMFATWLRGVDPDNHLFSDGTADGVFRAMRGPARGYALEFVEEAEAELRSLRAQAAGLPLDAVQTRYLLLPEKMQRRFDVWLRVHAPTDDLALLTESAAVELAILEGAQPLPPSPALPPLPACACGLPGIAAAFHFPSGEKNYLCGACEVAVVSHRGYRGRLGNEVAACRCRRDYQESRHMTRIVTLGAVAVCCLPCTLDLLRFLQERRHGTPPGQTNLGGRLRRAGGRS